MEDENINDLIINKLNAEADKIIADKLLPAKSRQRYEQTYQQFIEWQKEKKCASFSEEIFIVFFNEKAKKLKPSSLWSIYSMLRTTIKLNHDIDITNYVKLKGILKAEGTGFVKKKSMIFSAVDIEKFLNKAPNNKYLDMKVNIKIKFIMSNLINIT